MTSLREIDERVRAEYGTAIGRPVADLVTPALILDLPVAARNITRMAALIEPMPAALRPHFKTHKSPALARMQVAAGAGGLSVATVWEAAILAQAGLDDLFIVNTVVGPAKIGAVAELARERTVAVAVDDAPNAAELSRAALAAGSTLGVLIEVDTGMRRGGFDTASSVVDLARRLVELPGLDFRGVTGYEGHCSEEADVARRTELQHAAMRVLLDCVEALAGIGIPCPIVSAGGTRTWWLTAATPGITEIQAGTYALMDQFHSGVEGGFEHALRVVATVISKQRGRFIVDAGSKSIGDPNLTTVAGLDVANLGFDEEHGRFADVSGPDATPVGVAVGDVLELIPGYAPATVNMFDAFHVVENGVVTDIWPVVPRGPGHHGLIEGTPPR
ncbi:MAG: alanine racemase [Actinomycetia bacterium]|nr:alanine racemase [Actinomycetes bacterium]